MFSGCRRTTSSESALPARREYDFRVALWNDFVIRVLQSPAYRLLSNSPDVVRFNGRRSGRTVMTPTQYVLTGESLVILVGNPRNKNWRRNFIEPRDVDVLVKESWRAMFGSVITGKDNPQLAERLLTSCLSKFPRTRRAAVQPRLPG